MNIFQGENYFFVEFLINIIEDLLTSTWTFLQSYGWITVFITILAYVIYNKYIYDFLNTREENRKLIEQKKFGEICCLTNKS